VEFVLHHIAISCTNIDRSTDFYGRFGFKTVHQWRAEDGSLEIRHLRLGEAVLEIFWYREHADAPETSKQLSTDLPRVGVKHFGLQVESIDETAKKLHAEGVISSPSVTDGKTGVRYLFLKDPDGILVEVLEDHRGV
jgi:glyoxylase I family protein